MPRDYWRLKTTVKLKVTEDIINETLERYTRQSMEDTKAELIRQLENDKTLALDDCVIATDQIAYVKFAVDHEVKYR